MSQGGDLFQEWRKADRTAHALERLIVRASLQSLDGKGPSPSPGDRDRALRLRRTADDLFVLAMDEMKRRADAAKR
jgi:hypothetical protein